MAEKHYVVSVVIEEVTPATPEMNTHSRREVQGTRRSIRDVMRVVIATDGSSEADLAGAIDTATRLLNVRSGGE